MEIGIIGAGDMGCLTAKILDKAGYVVRAYDLPDKRNEVEKRLGGTRVGILDDGAEVARRSDLLLFAVPTENLDDAVRQFVPEIKEYAVVGGLTSVKHHEVSTLTKHLPKKRYIVTCHQLYGPSTDPDGQTVAVMKIAATPDVYNRAVEVYSLLGSHVVEISVHDHDRMVADTQVLTHHGFQSIGTAWKNKGYYPWEDTEHKGGIDNVKALIALRLYGTKPHINAGLAFYNQHAGRRVAQYDRSVQELYIAAVEGRSHEVWERLMRAGEAVFSNSDGKLLLDDRLMGEFSLASQRNARPNSELMLWGAIDAWHQLKANPYTHLLCGTPNFRLRLGLAEYLYKNEELRQNSLLTLLNDPAFRGHDQAFTTAVREWATTIRDGINHPKHDPFSYYTRFERTRKFLGDERIEAGTRKSDDLIRIMTKAIKNSNSNSKEVNPT
ncbi:prephenate dehydrogenase [Candidatus Woesearchaeota archaeon]|nr:prephenate dehydrogenase [Candidatus Woesearchaeota archaeon]